MRRRVALLALTSLVLCAATLPANSLSAQTSYFTLGGLAAAYGEDPRANDSRLRIPSIGVDAAVGRHFIEDGAPASPNPYGPGDIAWYDFGNRALGGRPGSNQNMVMSGHVNYDASVSYAGVRYRGPGVFSRLGELHPGDIVEVERGGRTYRYAVSWRQTLAGDDLQKWADLVRARVPIESITLYTCDGAFDPVTRTYSSRFVVRAELLEGTPNRFAAPLGSRFSAGTSGTTHPVALAGAQRWPVIAIYGRDESTGTWLVYRPGAPRFANTLLGHLREDSFVIIQF